MAVEPIRPSGLDVQPFEVLQEADGVTITAPDVPEMVTCGDTREEAVARAEDAMVTALSFYLDDGKAVPAPSAADGRPVVAVPLLEATKMALHEAMIAASISNVELGRRMGVGENEVHWLRDLLHRSHVGQVEAALRALGRRMVQEVAAA